MVILSETLLGEDTRSCSKAIRKNILQETQRLSGTIDDLLSIKSNRAWFKTDSFEITPITYPVHTSYRSGIIFAKQNEVRYQSDFLLTKIYIYWETTLQITSAFYNILDNAIKYTEEGKESPS